MSLDVGLVSDVSIPCVVHMKDTPQDCNLFRAYARLSTESLSRPSKICQRFSPAS
jgi:hypothetical protein